MVSLPTVTYTELNAYVDGELSDERAAQIAEIAACNADIAQTISAIASLKAALQEFFAQEASDGKAPLDFCDSKLGQACG